MNLINRSIGGLLLGLVAAGPACAAGGDATVLGRTYLSPITPVPMNNAYHSSTADQAGHAATADQATAAQTAVTAQQAAHAAMADDATNAANAALAERAINADAAATAQAAQTAAFATAAQTATSAQTAVTAQSATTTQFAWASSQTQVFPDPASASAYGQMLVDATNAIYLASAGCTGIFGSCAAGDAWVASGGFYAPSGGAAAANGPCLKNLPNTSQNPANFCDLFVVATLLPPTATTVHGTTYYMAAFNPGWIAPPPTTSTDPGGNGGGDGSGVGGGDGGGGGSGSAN